MIQNNDYFAFSDKALESSSVPIFETTTTESIEPDETSLLKTFMGVMNTYDPTTTTDTNGVSYEQKTYGYVTEEDINDDIYSKSDKKASHPNAIVRFTGGVGAIIGGMMGLGVGCFAGIGVMTTAGILGFYIRIIQVQKC